MATTATNQSTAVAENSDGNAAWSSVANGIADNNAYATVTVDGDTPPTPPDNSNRLKYTAFAFTEPADGDDVTDLFFEFAMKRAVGGSATITTIQLVVGGSIVGSAYTINRTIGSAESWLGLTGSVVTNFGTTLTGAQLKASNFGVAVKVATTGSAVVVSADACRATATYTPGATGQPTGKRTGGVSFGVGFVRNAGIKGW